MELNKEEISVVERTAEAATRRDICELEELQLALVGGGIGETVL